MKLHALFLLGILSVPFASGQETKDKEAEKKVLQTKPVEWEYLQKFFKDEVASGSITDESRANTYYASQSAKLNGLGKEGWELIEVQPMKITDQRGKESQGFTYFFRRQRN